MLIHDICDPRITGRALRLHLRRKSAMHVGQLLVIDPQQVQQRRLEVMHMDSILNRVDTEIARRTERRARLATATGQPCGDGVVGSGVSGSRPA